MIGKRSRVPATVHRTSLSRVVSHRSSQRCSCTSDNLAAGNQDAFAVLMRHLHDTGLRQVEHELLDEFLLLDSAFLVERSGCRTSDAADSQ